MFIIFSVPSVVKFPHDVRGNIEVVDMVGSESIPILLESPQIEEASQNIIPPTPSTSQATSSQLPITDPASVSAKTKGNGRAAKRARVAEEVTQTNTAVTYLELDKESVSSTASNNNSEVPSYLIKAAPTTLSIDELRKHVMIADIEKSRALTRMANKVVVFFPTSHKILKQLDHTPEFNNADHAYQAQDD